MSASSILYILTDLSLFGLLYVRADNFCQAPYTEIYTEKQKFIIVFFIRWHRCLNHSRQNQVKYIVLQKKFIDLYLLIKFE